MTLKLKFSNISQIFGHKRFKAQWRHIHHSRKYSIGISTKMNKIYQHKSWDTCNYDLMQEYKCHKEFMHLSQILKISTLSTKFHI